jgi:hypothetical protein
MIAKPSYFATEEEISVKKIGGENKKKTTGFSSEDEEIEFVGRSRRSTPWKRRRRIDWDSFMT